MTCPKCNDTGCIAIRASDASYAGPGPLADDARGYVEIACRECRDEAERLYLATEAADLAPATEADRRAAREDNWFSRNHASDKAFAMRNSGQREE